MSKISRAIGAVKLSTRANGPTILVVGGVCAMGAAVILACKKTLKLEETIAPHMAYVETIDKMQSQTDKATIKANKRSGNPAVRNRVDTEPTIRTNDGSTYTEDDAWMERYGMYGRIGVDCAKLYALPLVLFTSGMVMVFKGHDMMQQRNAALAVAFTTLKKSFDNYRSRVLYDQGEEKDQYYMNGSTTKINVDGEISRSRDWEASSKDPYNRVFSQESSNQWQNDLGCNKDFVGGQQRFAQQLLNRQGYLYLSDVYRSLGIAESDVSRVVGWKVITLPDGTRNVPVVDFGLDTPIPDDWKYNQRREIFLDFNCQGLIVGGKVQKLLEGV